jgi:hypothetical protein
MACTPIRPEHSDRTTEITNAPGFAVRRLFVGYAYPANGNVHNPTPQYHWLLLLHGRPVDNSSRRGALVEAARCPDADKTYSEPVSSSPPNQYTHTCTTCGVPIAPDQATWAIGKLPPRQWVDQRNNVASFEPCQHEHSPLADPARARRN